MNATPLIVLFVVGGVISIFINILLIVKFFNMSSDIRDLRNHFIPKKAEETEEKQSKKNDINIVDCIVGITILILAIVGFVISITTK